MGIEILACNRTNMPRIIKLRQLAEDQQQESELIAEDKLQKRYTRRITRSMKPITPDFIVLHPWRNECHSNGYVFVSHNDAKPRPRILGWMMVHIRIFTTRTRHKPLTIAHVDYISTNHNSAGGIGKGMMKALETEMRRLECDFIELMPLPAVVGFYEKLGYRLQFEEVNYYTLWLNSTREENHGALVLYEKELIEEMERLGAEMEAEEAAEFEPIFAQFTEEEQERYRAMQEEDDSTRIAIIMTYGDPEGGIEEVRKMLD